MAYIDVTHSFSDNTNRRIGNGLVILALLLSICLPYSFWQKKQFANSAEIAVARIVENTGAPKISFRNKSGEIITTKLSGWRPKNLKEDDEVEIAYSLKDPQRVELMSNLWTGPLVIALSAIVIGTIGRLMRRGILVGGPLKQSRIKIGL
jgi:hypothetical protein